MSFQYTERGQNFKGWASDEWRCPFQVWNLKTEVKEVSHHQSDNGGCMHDTEKGKQKTKPLSDPKNFNHNI